MGKFLDIGERLKEERVRLDYNQTDFAALAGVGRKTQFNYEKGDRKPDAAYLAAVAVAGVDVSYVLNGKENFGHAPPMGEERPSPYHLKEPPLAGEEDPAWRDVMESFLNVAFQRHATLNGAAILAIVDKVHARQMAGNPMTQDELETTWKNLINPGP